LRAFPIQLQQATRWHNAGAQGDADINDLSGDGGLLKKSLSEGTGAVVQAGLKVDVEYYGA
jgi:hypothetical protein